MKELLALFEPVLEFAKADNRKMIIMWVIGGILIYLAIKKQMEPTLLLPIGFGAILMNFPGVNVSGQIASVIAGSLVLSMFLQ